MTNTSPPSNQRKQAQWSIDQLFEHILQPSLHNPAHIWITGTPGSGKSHLLSTLKSTTNTEFIVVSAKWSPFSSRHIADWLECIAVKHEISQDRTQLLPQVSNSLIERTAERTLNKLLNFAQTQQKKLLLLQDCADIWFEQMTALNPSGLAWWKRVLQREQRLILVAAESPLSTNRGCPKTWRTVLHEITPKPHTIEKLKPPLHDDKTIRGLAHFVQQHPAVSAALYRLPSDQTSSQRLRNALSVLDSAYLGQIRAIAPQARYVLDTLLAAGRPQTAAQLARQCVLPVTSISAQLKRLEQAQYITTTPLPHTARYGYLATDQVMTLWYGLRVIDKAFDNRAAAALAWHIALENNHPNFAIITQDIIELLSRYLQRTQPTDQVFGQCHRHIATFQNLHQEAQTRYAQRSLERRHTDQSAHDEYVMSAKKSVLFSAPQRLTLTTKTLHQEERQHFQQLLQEEQQWLRQQTGSAFLAEQIHNHLNEGLLDIYVDDIDILADNIQSLNNPILEITLWLIVGLTTAETIDAHHIRALAQHASTTLKKYPADTHTSPHAWLVWAKISLIRLGDIAQAEQLLTHATQFSESTEVWATLGMLNAEFLKNNAHADKIWQKSLRLGLHEQQTAPLTGLWRIAINLAITQIQQNNFQSAELLLNQALTLIPPQEESLGLISALQLLCSYQSNNCMENHQLISLQSTFPRQADTWIISAIVAMIQNNPQTAEAHLCRAMTIDPCTPQLLQPRLMLLLQQKHYVQAERLCNQHIETIGRIPSIARLAIIAQLGAGNMGQGARTLHALLDEQHDAENKTQQLLPLLRQAQHHFMTNELRNVLPKNDPVSELAHMALDHDISTRLNQEPSWIRHVIYSLAQTEQATIATSI